MTFSIVARCPRTGQFGAAVSSSSPAVAARCIRVRAGVGAAASQNITDPALGDRLIEALAASAGARAALDALVAATPGIQYRQLMAVDGRGDAALFSGEHTLGIVTGVADENAACAGNMLRHDGVPAAMLDAFRAAGGTLDERLLAALRAGRDAGGEAGPVHSAGLLVAETLDWPLFDLRVDWHDTDPIAELERVWAIYAPQAADYVTRARHPQGAPSFGVPGDE